MQTKRAICQNAVKDDLQIWSFLVPAPARACRYHPRCDRDPGTAMCKNERKSVIFIRLGWL